MKGSVQIASITDQLQVLATRLVGQESMRADAILRVKENKRLSDSAKQEELAKVSGLEVLTALRAQILILKADLDAASKDWANLGMVLRLAALPMGATPAAAATMGLLRDEALALENDPRALQSAMEAAALEKDWPRVYSLALGRLDENGTPLRQWRDAINGIQGLRFDCLDLPSQEAVMEAIYKGETAALQAEQAWQHAVGQSSMTTAVLILNGSAKLEQARFARQNRMLMTPAEALKRAEDERVSPGDRYTRIGDEGGLYAIFDHSNGITRFLDQKSGPAYLKKLNDLTRIPSPAEGLAFTSPVNSDPGTIPGGN